MNQFILPLILTFTLLTRIWRLDFPPEFYFDEVYHVVTAQAYSRNNPAGYEWWHEPPQPGTAYDWLHPPLAKLIQAGSINLLGDHSFAWRFPGVIAGTFSVYLVYLLAKHLFPPTSLVPILSAFLFSLDGLNLVQSRITMNDIFLTAAVLASLVAFFKFTRTHNRYFLLLTGFLTGLSIAIKWTGVFLLLLYLSLETIYFLSDRHFHLSRFLTQLRRYLFAFIVLPALIYLASYAQFWLQGHTLTQFWHLHQQIWWYQTKLTATHSYQSPALSWPLNLRPVWYYVNYTPTTIANIYALGHPLIFWAGLLAVIYTPIFLFSQRPKTKDQRPLVILILAYFAFFLPWVFSPRIMFLYHYLPATPFMIILLAWLLSRLGKSVTIAYCLLAIALFIFFYPHWTALPIPKDWVKFYFWFPSWK
ncbi:MAG: phospholipid carrier-dependent glycosyltransferase [Candidatus Chisholmbacteria bacterium]|nr:phospholipid carrier-dependent glycosyltransferase [Candidatus Chisholmbacteria bacterium]